MKRKIILCLALSLYFLSAYAQDTADADRDRQYVTDQLRLSLYSEANSQSSVIKLLQSGDMLLVDEIRGNYALVTAPDGSRGWVKRGFLVTTPTASTLLKEERDKNAMLAKELEKLADSKIVIDTYEKDMDALTEKHQSLAAQQQEATATIASLEQELEQRQRELELKQAGNEPATDVLVRTFRAYWKIIVPALLALLIISFFISKAIVEARIRSKFHGIKIW